jgi:uncharacterized protein YecE (DUF72 family)
MLAYYQRNFDSVEINSSFYRLPKPPAVRQWRISTPADFQFAVKGSRFLTHMKKLKDAEEGLLRFMRPLELLEEKLGPVLFQLPPHWPVNLQRLESFIGVLPPQHRYAFEFRNDTWNSPAAYELLRRNNIATCIFHLAGYQSPMTLTADITYIRLHGPGAKYQGSYTDEALQGWADRIVEWSPSLKGVYVYFDNDEAGHAPRNALRLREMVGD